MSNETKLRSWIEDEEGLPQEAIDWAKNFGEELSRDNDRNYKKLSTTQLRRFFGHLKGIQARVITNKLEAVTADGVPEDRGLGSLRSEVLLLRPMLAYANGRDKKRGRNETKIDLFAQHIDWAIKAVGNSERNFKNFMNLVEAIVAYHKASGGE